MSGELRLLISMVRFIFAVIMQVNIPICDIFDTWHDYYDVHHHIYTVLKIYNCFIVINTSITSDTSQTADDERGILLHGKNIFRKFAQNFFINILYK